MIITRKIEVEFKDLEKEIMFKKWYSLMPRLHNTIVTNIFLNDIIKEKMANYDSYFNEFITKIDTKISEEYEKMRGCKDKEKNKKGMEIIEKFKNERNKINFEGKKKFDEQFKDVFGKQFDGFIYNILRQDAILSEIPSSITTASLTNLGFYKKMLNSIKNGEERIRMYSKGMPMPLPKSQFEIIYNKESDKFNIKTIGSTEITMRFGRDASNNRIRVEKVFDGIDSLSDSQLQYISKKKKWFLLMCIDIPQDNKKQLNDNIVVGVDLGINIPAYCSTNIGFDKLSLGTREDIIDFRNGIRNQRKRIQQSINLIGKCGQGRNRKMQVLDRLADKESAFMKNYNHKLSREIVKFAIKNNAKYINLEFLEGFGKDEDGKSIEKFKWMCSNWSYFELKTMIEYKAKMEGIEVRYIDPYHTSQTCHVCGHYEKGQRLTQEKFICKSCGEEHNADFNASKNIAKSTKFVTEKRDCEFYKKRLTD